MQSFGDNIAETQYHDKRFRLYFQNINGLKLSSNSHHLKEAVGTLLSLNASVACLAETNLKWYHSEAYATVETQFRLGFNNVRLVPSSSRQRSESVYQAGGTLTALLGRWCGRKMDVGSYNWGLLVD